MKVINIILVFGCAAGLIHRVITCETINDIGFAIIWATAVLINIINFKFEEYKNQIR